MGKLHHICAAAKSVKLDCNLETLFEYIGRYCFSVQIVSGSLFEVQLGAHRKFPKMCMSKLFVVFIDIKVDRRMLSVTERQLYT